MRVRISAGAEADLLDGHAFYESQQAGLGAYFLDALTADIDALQLFAGVHLRPFGRFHRALAKRFPFAIYEGVDAETATVIAVLDCRQNPASIKTRVGSG